MNKIMHRRKKWLLTSYLYFSPALALFSLSRASWRPLFDFFSRRDREATKLPESDTAEKKPSLHEMLQNFSHLPSVTGTFLVNRNTILIYKWILFILQMVLEGHVHAAPVTPEIFSKTQLKQLKQLLFYPPKRGKFQIQLIHSRERK